MALDKAAVLKAVIVQMKDDLDKHWRALGDARAGATSSEVSSDGKYDTRSTEASYLARGHAMHFETLQADVAEMETYRPPIYEQNDPIGKGALVGLSLRGYTDLYFILPKGGGVEVQIEIDGVETEITVMTPTAPLYAQLKGKKVGGKVQVGDNRFKSTVDSIC